MVYLEPVEGVDAGVVLTFHGIFAPISRAAMMALLPPMALAAMMRMAMEESDLSSAAAADSRAATRLREEGAGEEGEVPRGLAPLR
jgi:hypothetical protein